MAFFSGMGQPGMGMGAGGLGGSPSAFTSPGMDPMTLALLLRMQNAGAGGMGGAGGPQLPAPPPPGVNAAGPPAMAGAGAQPGQQGGLLQMLGQLSALDPAKLHSMLGMLGMGGGGLGGGGLPGAGPASGMPGLGTGGLY